CIVIAGPNGAGKSSVVDGIMQIVAPAGVKGIPKPIHDGATEAFVEMTTTEARARRTYKDDGAGKFDVWALDGAKYPSGRDFMLKSTGGQVFDTAEFASMAEKDQRAELLRRVELPFDLATVDRERAGVYDQRTETNRSIDQLTGQLAGITTPSDDTPAEEVPAASIIAEFNHAQDHNAAVVKATNNIDGLKEGIRSEEEQIARLTERLALLRSDLKSSESAAALLAPIIDVDDISARLESVEQTNAAIREGQQYRRVAASLAVKKQQATALTTELAAIDKKKADGLSAAVFPVEGLSIDDTGITHNNIPFKQINGAMQIVVAFDLFTQDKPDLRLIFIKNGDLLDATSLAGIEKIAVERSYYVIVERDRDESRELGWTLTDGELA
ncbi:MAG: hypothetical protein JWL77_7078, partial [Chthonomonadaceae bacterium]|nr:hypothetical protein [Chthonomonadaceae bacterium]